MIETNVPKKELPQFPEPYWRASTNLPSFPKLDQHITVDTAVVGGGISGITTAYLLAKAGVKVALLEAGNILNGTTGHTTAKITAQHDIIYDELIKQIGQEQAKLYYQANMDALNFIKQTVDEHKIECGFSEQDAYVYTNTESSMKKINDEFAAYQKLGINGEYVTRIAIPLPIKAAIEMKKQAQFHPLQYLAVLVQKIVDEGGVIYENTTAKTMEEAPSSKVITQDGFEISCENMISCSHFPFYDGMGFYFSRLHAQRSYVLGIKSDKQYPGGMYLSAEDPKRSIRYTTTSSGENLILIGGQNHKTGQGICTIQHYEALQAFAEDTFGIQEIAYRWSAQDLTTLDKIPYIGQISSLKPNMYVATGYRKWGMSTGTAAALLLRDLILGNDNPYHELYTPSRFDLTPDVKNFVVQNADVAKHLIAGKLEIVHRKPEDLEPGEGSVVTVNGKRAGAYKDDQGKLHLVDTTCTHMGCEVEWNDGDRSWDCPCHGSRFTFDGDVMEGPAKKSLAKLN
ncbi:FAD-dependent oxidoreductase [Paenibacillus eucommiae]|uniref:Glycine/D-amino acid oxidase-like deaminating enzyme/nitrite reductase/ring-hydroxylating ferredoxin subunit n=1 Tax=Paenibacillus eucommiae TaxID=1355755 RepID=A0ABS4J8Y4_9BACL|nr:FAD-dependent oxidoreductase [Paenibacillus eucommiae]MBP1996308.1 glycine/D-amino acid oxidase-like deaminating enzyme/nitrite reductase/ring-hydroxylating ferredoxin subunit [Paenibacillus eucommiae]